MDNIELDFNLIAKDRAYEIGFVTIGGMTLYIIKQVGNPKIIEAHEDDVTAFGAWFALTGDIVNRGKFEDWTVEELVEVLRPYMPSDRVLGSVATKVLTIANRDS
jgi:hypothetical protein